MPKSSKKYMLQIVGGIFVIVAVTWGAISLLSRHSAVYNTVAVSYRDLKESVDADGTVAAGQNSTLAFNMQGRIAAIYKNVGDSVKAGEILATLDTGTLSATLLGARADVRAAEAKLSQTERGARPEEQALSRQKYSDATTALISAMKSAYLSIEDSLIGKSDALFTNGNSVNPVINIRTQSQNEKSSIQMERLSLYGSMQNLKVKLAELDTSDASSLSTSTLMDARNAMRDEFAAAKAYFDHLSAISGNLNLGDSGQNQSTIDSERGIVTAASQEVAGAASAEQSVDAAWSAARDSSALVNAGSTPEDIEAAGAGLEKAQASVQGLESQLKSAEIIAPYDGVITAIDLKVGEIYVPGLSAGDGIGIIDNGSFKIKTYVPENDIGKVKIGDIATVTFDAYGPSQSFNAHVSLVDPAETAFNGTKAYKVTLSFDDESDIRIKSGLTANAVIATNSVPHGLAVPSRAIIMRGADTFVLYKDPVTSQFVDKKVRVGIRSDDGYTQVITGLNEGDMVANFGNGN